MILLRLKTALRSARKHSASLFINMAGLILSFGCSFLIFLYVQYENSFDRFYPDHNRILRIAKSFVNDAGELVPDAFTPGALAPSLKSSFSHIESVTRIEPIQGKALIQVDEKSFYESSILAVDPDFFNVFNLDFIEGNPARQLMNDNAVVITESLRQKLFGNELALGRLIRIDILGDEKVVEGVVKDIPRNSHFHFKLLFKLNTSPYEGYSIDQEWNGYNWYTYVKVLTDQKIESLTTEIQQRVDKNSPELRAEYFFQPLTDIHLHSKLKSELESNGSFAFVNILTVTGFFILLVGLINFINLSMVRVLHRSKEAGINKVNGATHRKLFTDYFIESILIMVVAELMSLLLVIQFLPHINSFFDIAISFQQMDRSQVAIWIPLFVLLCMGAATMPAIYYAKVSPIKVLKGDYQNGGQAGFRKMLIVFQFVVVTVLLVSIVVIHRQMQFMRNSSLGFDKNQLLVLSGADGGEETKNRFLQLPEVIKASFANSLPGEKNMFFMAAVKGSSRTTIMDYSLVDYDYFDVLGLKIIEGRSFSRDFPSDRTTFPLIVNETAAHVLGLSSKVVGTEITPNPKDTNPMYFKIIGVVKDFNFNTFHEEIKPYLFTFSPTSTNLVLKLSSNDYSSTLKRIKSVWKDVYKSKPFDFYFLDESFYSNYKEEERFQTFLLWLTVVTIAIACSGLLAVSSFLISKKKREVGIRKAMGATSLLIFSSLCMEYIWLSLISIIISFPLSFFIAKQWLSNFAYQVPVNGIEFVIAATTLIILSVGMVSYQSLKMASTSPVEILRSE